MSSHMSNFSKKIANKNQAVLAIGQSKRQPSSHTNKERSAMEKNKKRQSSKPNAPPPTLISSDSHQQASYPKDKDPKDQGKKSGKQREQRNKPDKDKSSDRHDQRKRGEHREKSSSGRTPRERENRRDGRDKSPREELKVNKKQSSPQDMLEVLLRPKLDEIERETELMQGNMEQFIAWEQQLVDLMSKLQEMRALR